MIAATVITIAYERASCPYRLVTGSTDLHAAVKQALQLGAIGFDAVKHLILCRVERRPPRLDLSIYPFLPRATVETTSVKAYMRLLSAHGEEAA